MFSKVSASSPDPIRYLLSRSLAGAVHEFRAPAPSAAHAAFVVMQLMELPCTVPILWVSHADCVYPPGLAWLGLDPSRCLFAQAKDDAEILGTLEVGLRGGMAGVAECAAMPRLAARRLALAAKTGGSVGFILRHAPAFTQHDSTAFATRWLITPMLSEVSGRARLRAELLYAKGGRPGMFQYEIREMKDGRTPPALTLVEPSFAAEPEPASKRHAG